MGRPKKQEVLLRRLDILLRVLGHATACTAFSNFVYRWCYGDAEAREELRSSAEIASIALGRSYSVFRAPAQIALLAAREHLTGKPISSELLYQSANLFRHAILAKSTVKNYFGLPFVLRNVVGIAMTMDVDPEFHEWGLSFASETIPDTRISEDDRHLLDESEHNEHYLVRAVDKYHQSSKLLLRDPMKKVLFLECVGNLKTWLDLFVDDFSII